MRGGYDRNDVYRRDGLDEYEEDEEGEGEEYEEEEEEEEEEPKPTQEELEYLELRQKLKEAARKKLKKENGTSSFTSFQDKKKKLPYDNYGSFFGPSQPVIAQRVIQESKSLLENQHLTARISNSSNCSKKISSTTNAEARPAARNPSPKVVHETQTKMKAQKLKDSRDYSFLLSDESELPAPRKGTPPRNVSMRDSDARSAQAQQKSRQSASNHSKPFSNGRDKRKQVPTNHQMQQKAAYHQTASGSKGAHTTSAETRKQIGSSIGNGPGRPMGPKGLPTKMPVPSKASYPNKLSTLNKSSSSVQKTPLSRLPSSVQKQHLEQRREVRGPEKAKVNSRMTAAPSKPQSNTPKQIQPRAPVQTDRPKKRPARPFDDDDEDEDPSALIRKMFRYDPRKYNGVDEDDSDMEANYDDILREEKRSARIAKEEDERELRLIEEEERRERMKKEAKKRKLGQR